MSCSCDELHFPRPPEIAAGLPSLPRQLVTFPEVRAAMLSLLPTKPALVRWRGRDEADLGLMLVDLWAYVCDALSFYEKVIADEAYLRTARQRVSLRRLTALIGYLPRPPVGAAARLALLADGVKPTLVPAGTAFRSGAFDGEPPQVFETSADVLAHPVLNRLDVAPPLVSTLPATVSELFLEPGTARVSDGDFLIVRIGLVTAARRARRISRMADTSGRRLVKLELDFPVIAGAETPIATARVWKPQLTSNLRAKSDASAVRSILGHTVLVLERTVTSIKKGDLILVCKGDDARYFTVDQRAEGNLEVAPASSFTVDGKVVATPAVLAPFTFVTLDSTLNGNQISLLAAKGWTNADAADLVVRHGAVDAGRVAGVAKTGLAPGDSIVLGGLRPPLGSTPAPTAFLLRDAEGRGLDLAAGLSLATGQVHPVAGQSWAPPLALPVAAHGNVVEATRGETVPHEVLGSGDGGQAGMTFELRKKPLTYLPAPGTDSGVASTLQVWVDGLRWIEVPTFYGQGADAQVYVVRPTDDGGSLVRFGDGVRGARLPSGADNVIASYRFGAGAKAPPAGSIEQLARPTPGLKGVKNPVAAGGGADRAGEEEIRDLAPKSALLLGRAVSILDMEAAARAAPGVVDAAAAWRWDAVRQRPVVKVWFIGAASIAPAVSARLRALSDPGTPIDVTVAQPRRPVLSIDVESDPRAVAADVALAVRAALLDARDGLLPASRIGIGRPLFRSRIFAAVLEVRHATGVRGLLWNQSPFTSYGKNPGAGRFFDVEDSLHVTATAATGL